MSEPSSSDSTRSFMVSMTMFIGIVLVIFAILSEIDKQGVFDRASAAMESK